MRSERGKKDKSKGKLRFRTLIFWIFKYLNPIESLKTKTFFLKNQIPNMHSFLEEILGFLTLPKVQVVERHFVHVIQLSL